MAEFFHRPVVLSAEEVLKTEIVVNQALIDILIAKKIITEKELINSIRRIREEQDLLANGWESLL